MAESSPGVTLTERLSLHRLALDDAPYVLELLNEAAFKAAIGDKGVNTLEDARQYIADVPMAHYDKYGFGAYLVRQRTDDRPVGMCGLYQRTNLDVPDLGFALSEAFVSRGYAREAARAVIDQARRTFGLSLLAAIVDPRNARSIHLLDVLGFKRRGVYRLPDEDQDLCFYELGLQ